MLNAPFLLASCYAFLFAIFAGHRDLGALILAQNMTVSVDVGVILDTEILTGKKSLTSILMAVDDFYAVHGDYATRVVLHVRDAKEGAVGAAAAAVDLLKNVGVSCIVGPPTSTEATFVISLGGRTNVPVLSFSASSPTLSPLHNHFFVRTTTTDSAQVKAISALVRHFNWRQAIPVYSDSDFGTGIVPSLIAALQSAGARVPYRGVIPALASNNQIDQELRRLKALPARVFIVHALPELVLHIFQRATDLGMMIRGYAWITTDGVSSALDLFDPKLVVGAMRGVIGVRPWVNRSRVEVKNYTAQFEWRIRQRNLNSKEATEPSAIQLWAYDTIWAVAMAVEKLGPSARWTLRSPRSGDETTELGRLGVSQTGQALLNAIRSTRFPGLAGEFVLVHGELKSSAFEIVNVDDEGARIIGHWTPDMEIVKELQSVLWPGGGRTEAPKGWELPTGENKLQIAVPVKLGFDQFVKVENDRATGPPNVTGFCIDVFETALSLLPYSVAFEYKPVAYSYMSYDNLVYQVFLKKFDAVIGDTTILANRTQFVDFTMPYSESGVSMVVRVEDRRTNMWIFLEPLTVDLWLGSLAFFVLTGFMVWVIEHRDNKEFPGRPLEQLGAIFYFAFSILVFSHKEKLTSNLTRFAVMICTFVVMILTSSYTASLASMLTVQQLKPSVTNVDQLLSTGASIGYQDGSFTVAMLRRIGFKQTKLKSYSTAEQYAEALSKGSENGGVDAVFDEIPYLKLFLSQYRAEFTMVGPIYKTDGFGFVFPRGSPLVPDISRAILQVTEAKNMTSIEKKWFGEPNNSTSKSGNLGSSSLAFQNFGGLFLITGMASALALLIFLARFIYKEWGALKGAVYDQNSILGKVVAVFMHSYNAGETPFCPTLKRDDEYIVCDNEEMDQIQHNDIHPALPELVGLHSPLNISNLSDFSFASAEERMSSEEQNNPCSTRPEM